MNTKNDWLAQRDDGSVDVTLSRPISIDGTNVAAVRMREPTVGDQEVASNMSGTDASREIATFANLCGLSPDDIRKMPLRDYKRLQGAYLNFID